MRIVLNAIGVLLVAMPLIAQGSRRATSNPVGCYRATPALTYSAYGSPESGDSSWAYVSLTADGKARRPMLQPSRDAASKWSQRRDTLLVRVHDMLVGWDLTLSATESGWRGRGRYLTDVIGGDPIVREFALKRMACSDLPPAPPPPAREPSAERWAEFTKQFQSYVDSDKVVGATALLVRDGRVIGRYDTGFQDQAANVRVDSQTIYHWGSITKALTAISIMQLRDRGKLSLDDRIIRWVPELRQMHDPYGMIDSITIRMLLSHTGGFQNPTWPYGNNQPWEPFEPTTWNQLVAMMPYQQLVFRPGERYGYSNPGFVYLARVIEAISGDPWDAYVQKNIFAPLNLDRSYFRATPYFLASHRSHNYYLRRDSVVGSRLVDNGAEFDPGITSPNGAWNAPSSDLVKYVAFLTNSFAPGANIQRYEAVLSRASLVEMWTPVKPMSQGYESGQNQWMGLSFFILDRDGRRILGHTGSQAGFRSFFYFEPRSRNAIIVAFNTTNYVAPASSLQRALTDAALRLVAGQ
jgi:CubicO group peptidase (beta-lactamase class C family)